MTSIAALVRAGRSSPNSASVNFSPVARISAIQRSSAPGRRPSTTHVSAPNTPNPISASTSRLRKGPFRLEFKARLLSGGRGRKQPCNSPSRALDEGMFQYIALAEEKSWQPGPYEGVELLVLHKNETTGSVVVLRKFRAGLTVPAHIHPEANESVYILSGEWEESGTTYTTGAFFFAPKGVKHGPHHARTEVLSLTLFDGPLTVAP